MTARALPRRAAFTRFGEALIMAGIVINLFGATTFGRGSRGYRLGGNA
jgi:hypothetical protein